MNRLKDLRIENNNTQDDIAKIAGVSPMTVSRWENGESQIKPKKAKLLADYFHVTVGYLLGYTVIDPKRATDLEEYIFLNGDYSDPEKSRAEYFEKISKKIKLYKKVSDSLYGRFDKEKAFQIIELLESNLEDELDDVYNILANKLELALFRYMVQYQVMLPEFSQSQDRQNSQDNDI